jgi:beta-glucosidase
VDAARRADGMRNRLFLDPVLRGGYPKDVVDDLAAEMDLGFVEPDDEGIIAAPIDILGVNYYRPTVIAAASGSQGSDGGFGEVGRPPWPGAERITSVPRPGPRTSMGWDIDAPSLTALLRHIADRYGPVPLYVAENGAAFDDEVRPEGRVDDKGRIGYLDQHVRAALAAGANGVDLRGFFVWSLMDNFEWSEGYARRFGLVYVDYPTQRRIPKDSAHWYGQVIGDGGPTDVASETWLGHAR